MKIIKSDINLIKVLKLTSQEIPLKAINFKKEMFIFAIFLGCIVFSQIPSVIFIITKLNQELSEMSI